MICTSLIYMFYMILSIVLLLWIPNRVSSWGGGGHTLVADLLISQLTTRASKYIKSHLGTGTTLQEACVWADSVQWSEDLHFSYTPWQNCQPFEISRDCGYIAEQPNPRCIVTAIANYTARAVDVSLSPSDRLEAIKFLLHLVPDIHQPFHTGFREDAGATTLMLSNHNEELSLHEVWDDLLVKRVIKETNAKHKKKSSADEEGVDPWTTQMDILKSTSTNLWVDLENYECTNEGEECLSSTSSNGDFSTPTSIYSVALAMASSWASETAVDYTCNKGYMNENAQWITDTKVASRKYKDLRWKDVRTQLLKSVERLAYLFDEIARVYFSRLDAITPKLVKTSSIDFNTDQKMPAEESVIDSNPYNSLMIDFDPDDLVVDEGAGENVVSAVSEPISRKKATRKLKTRKSAEPTLPLTVDQYKDHLAFVKRWQVYVMTSRSLAKDKNYFPKNFYYHKVTYKQLVKGGSSSSAFAPPAFVLKTLSIAFDVTVFGLSSLTDHQLSLAMNAIRDVKQIVRKAVKNDLSEAREDEWTNTPLRNSDLPNASLVPLERSRSTPLVFTNAADEISDLRVSYKLDEPPHIFHARLVTDKTKYMQIQKQKLFSTHPSEIYCYVENIEWMFVAKIESLERLDARMKFNTFSMVTPYSPNSNEFFIDRYLYDAELDEEVVMFLDEVCESRQRKGFKPLGFRPSLWFEIEKLKDLFRANRPARTTLGEMLTSGEPIFLRYVAIPDSIMKAFISVEWSLNPSWRNHYKNQGGVSYISWYKSFST